MGKGGTASPTTDTLSSAKSSKDQAFGKAGKGESDGDAKAGKEASTGSFLKENKASEKDAKSEKV